MVVVLGGSYNPEPTPASSSAPSIASSEPESARTLSQASDPTIAARPMPESVHAPIRWVSAPLTGARNTLMRVWSMMNRPILVAEKPSASMKKKGASSRIAPRDV